MLNLESCPICGHKVEIHGGNEEWIPTFNDPDSGGSPYYITCEGCNLMFDYNSYDLSFTVDKWNKWAK